MQSNLCPTHCWNLIARKKNPSGLLFWARQQILQLDFRTRIDIARCMKPFPSQTSSYSWDCGFLTIPLYNLILVFLCAVEAIGAILLLSLCRQPEWRKNIYHVDSITTDGDMMGRKKKEEEEEEEAEQQSHQEVQHSQTIPYQVYLHNKTRNNWFWLRASSPPQDSTANCKNSTLPLAARDNNTGCARPLHTMAGKRKLPLLDLDKKSLFTSYY